MNKEIKQLKEMNKEDVILKLGLMEKYDRIEALTKLDGIIPHLPSEMYGELFYELSTDWKGKRAKLLEI